METVAARSEQAKTNSSILLCLGIFLLVVCVIMLIWLISNGVYEPGMPEVTICLTMPAFFIFGGGLASISEAVKQRRRHDATPVKLIVYDGRMLIFDDGYSCLPSDVIDVECENSPDNSPFAYALADFGELTVHTENKTYRYRNVADVRHAHVRLVELIAVDRASKSR